MGDTEPPPARQPPPAAQPRLMFPPPLQAPPLTAPVLADAVATTPVLESTGVVRKRVGETGDALEEMLETAAKGRKLAVAKKSGKKPKAKAKAAASKPKAHAAKAKGNGEGSPTLIVENSRSQIKAWAGRKGNNMNRIVSFKSITQMKARKTAVEWLVARCKELKINVPTKIK